MNNPIELWKSGPYPAGALVQWEGIIYRRKDTAHKSQIVPNEPPGTGWAYVGWQPLHAVADVEAMRLARHALETVAEFHHLYDSGQSALERLCLCLADLEVGQNEAAQVDMRERIARAILDGEEGEKP